MKPIRACCGVRDFFCCGAPPQGLIKAGSRMPFYFYDLRPPFWVTLGNATIPASKKPTETEIRLDVSANTDCLKRTLKSQDLHTETGPWAFRPNFAAPSESRRGRPFFFLALFFSLRGATVSPLYLGRQLLSFSSTGDVGNRGGERTTPPPCSYRRTWHAVGFRRRRGGGVW